MKNLNEYRTAILAWASDRDFDTGATVDGQLDKLFEEIGEFAGAAARSANPAKRDEMLLKMQDGLGDMFVVFCILAEKLGTELDFFDMEEYDQEANNAVLYLTAGCVAGLVEALRQNMGEDIMEPEEHFYFSVAIAKAVAEKNGFDFLACVDMAWNEIKDRKGRMINGVFVKESDL